MTPESIALLRLDAQQLRGRTFSFPGELLEWPCAVQGQDYAGAKWSLGVRLQGSRDAEIENSLDAGDIVRTWSMRGTLHLVGERDVRWILGLVAPRVIARNARRYRELELDERTLARGNEVLVRALEGGQRSRHELLGALEREGVSTSGQRSAYLLQRASLDGLIVQSISRRNVPVFRSLETAPVSLDGEAALSELARRYFQSRGPATLQDFTWWCGLPAADAKRGLEAARGSLIVDTFDGRTYWRSTVVEPLQVRGPQALLLPGFDEFIVAYKDRRASIRLEYAARMGVKNGMLSPTVVVDGQVVGTWRRSFKRGDVDVAVEYFDSQRAEVRDAVASAAAEYARFLDMGLVEQGGGGLT